MKRDAETKRRRDEVVLSRPPRRASAHSVSSSLRLSVSSCTAFTLTEILIVIAIIVLLLALAMPAFNLISGGKSVEGAANQLSAALGRARGQAIGLQKTTGVLFYADQKTGRQTMVIVQETDAPAGVTIAPAPSVWLDLLESDSLQLPPGVNAQFVHDATFTPAGVRTSDGYIGFNNAMRTAANAGAAPAQNSYGGVILFDGNGRLISSTYGFRFISTTGTWTALGKLLYPNASLLAAPTFNGVPGRVGIGLLQSQFGLVMYPLEVFTSNGGKTEDPVINDTAGAYGVAPNFGTEATEEAWIDSNATPFMVNRYNGTLVKGE